MKYIKTILFIVVAINVYSLIQKANSVSAFALTVQESKDIFCNTVIISIAMFAYLILIIKTKIR